MSVNNERKKEKEIKVEEDFSFCGHKFDVGLVKKSCFMQLRFFGCYGFCFSTSGHSCVLLLCSSSTLYFPSSF